jgi:uncharacterized RDD family membrane protein YckC
MSTAEPSFTWGADVDRRKGSSSDPRARSRRQTLLYVRAEAILIDGLVLLVPVLGAAALLSALFPHDGFFLIHREATPGMQGARTSVGAPGAILITTLALTYFYVCEAAFGQTFGKRRRGLRVQHAAGGQAGCNATSARTVLRLIDGLLFYAVGALVAVVTGRRRRRIGDWAGHTVVVFEDATTAAHRRPAVWRLAIYPAVWLALAGLAASALAHSVSERESALALVRAYVQARERGEAQRACSMLTEGQRLELVAIQSGGGYRGASASSCPLYILGRDASSHLLNPGLSGLVRSPLIAASSPLGVLAVYSREDPSFVLIAVREGGQLKLDVRGLERAEFVHACAAAGTLSPATCGCAFDRARAEGELPEGSPTREELAVLRADASSCGAPAGGFDASPGAGSSGLRESTPQ